MAYTEQDRLITCEFIKKPLPAERAAEVPGLYRGLIHGLKCVERSWQRTFPGIRPVGMSPKPRRRSPWVVETVSGHSFGLDMLGLIVGHGYLTDSSLLLMSKYGKTHDVPELKTPDVITAVLKGEELEKVLRLKELAEKRVMEKMRKDGGTFMREVVYPSWAEYTSGATPEAVLMRQLDKLEVVYMTWALIEAGVRLPPDEFIGTARSKLTLPVLRPLVDWLEVRMAELENPKRRAPKRVIPTKSQVRQLRRVILAHAA